jgi:hypothetical protein
MKESDYSWLRRLRLIGLRLIKETKVDKRVRLQLIKQSDGRRQLRIYHTPKSEVILMGHPLPSSLPRLCQCSRFAPWERSKRIGKCMSTQPQHTHTHESDLWVVFFLSCHVDNTLHTFRQCHFLDSKNQGCSVRGSVKSPGSWTFTHFNEPFKCRSRAFKS